MSDDDNKTGGVPDHSSQTFPKPAEGWPPTGYPQTPSAPVVRPNEDRKPSK